MRRTDLKLQDKIISSPGSQHPSSLREGQNTRISLFQALICFFIIGCIVSAVVTTIMFLSKFTSNWFVCFFELVITLLIFEEVILIVSVLPGKRG